MGMSEINFADVATLNGGSLHVVCKTYKVKGVSKTTAYYFRKKEEALDIIMNALNYIGMEDDNLISMTYARYDDQGHAQEFFILYDKDRRFEE